MKNTIKLFSIIFLAFSFMMAGSVYAQTTKAEEKEKKVLEKEQSDLRASVVKQAKKDARKLEKEGWQSMGLPIFDQLVEIRMKEKETDAAGNKKYIVSYQFVTARTFTAAQSQADAVARMRIAQAMGSSVAMLIDEAVANHEISAKEGETYQLHVENAKEMVTQKLGRTVKVMEYYQELSNGNVRVRIGVVYDMKAAISIEREMILEELKKESDINKAQLEKIMGFDKLSDQISKTMPQYDEVLD